MVQYVFKAFKIIILAGLLAWFGFFISKKIDLTTADLGRHIANGSVFLHGSSADIRALLQTNYYSYTQSDYPFVNHHWGSGVIFYFVYNIGGFMGLSIFYVVLASLAFLLYFWLALKRSNWLISVSVALLLIPIIANRAEVRPEVFTYLFTGIFFWIILEFIRLSKNSTSPLPSPHKGRGLWLLPLVMLVWVNLHIGFIFGFFILGAFGLIELVKMITCQNDGRHFGKYKENFIRLFFTGVLCVLTALINPAGIKGLLYPFNIFRSYGYMIVENQSIKFLENLGITSNLNFGLYKIVFGLAILSFLTIIILRIFDRRGLRKKENMPWVENLIMFSLGVLGYLGIRHFPSFGFVALPVMAGNLGIIYKRGEASLKIPIRGMIRRLTTVKAVIIPLAIFTIFISVYNGFFQIKSLQPIMGFGLLPKQEKSSKFFLDNGLKGPVFNNYDIGGYLIFSLYPKEKVFVDNRPEAYSIDFFENLYKAPQMDDEKWKELLGRYGFNSIFFSHRDYTPWGQNFLISRVKDANWAVVYYDPYAIIMLKRNSINGELIKKYEIPKSMFVAK